MSLAEDKVIDIDLSPIKKSKIRINGDQNTIIELNLSDTRIIERLSTAYKNLQDLEKEVAELSSNVNVDVEDGNEEDFTKAADELAKSLAELDRKMRDEVDYLFDSKVSDICVPDGTMYDPHDGQFTFEYIIEQLSHLYTNNFNEEFEKMKKRVNKHTAKYTQDHQRKQRK